MYQQLIPIGRANCKSNRATDWKGFYRYLLSTIEAGQITVSNWSVLERLLLNCSESFLFKANKVGCALIILTGLDVDVCSASIRVYVVQI